MIPLPNELISLILSYLPYQSFVSLLDVNTISNRLTSELCLRSLFHSYNINSLSYSQLQRSLSYISNNTTYFHPSYKHYPLRWAEDEFLIDIFDRLLMLHRNEIRVLAHDVNRAYPYVGGCVVWLHNQELYLIRGDIHHLAKSEVDEIKIVDSRIMFRSKNEWYLWERVWSATVNIEKLSPSIIPYETIVNGTLCVVNSRYCFDYILDNRGCLSHRNIILAENVQEFWSSDIGIPRIYYLTSDGRLLMFSYDRHELLAQDVGKVIVHDSVYYLTRNKDLYRYNIYSHQQRLITSQVDAICMWGTYLYFITLGNLYVWSNQNELVSVKCHPLPLNVTTMSVSRICNDEGNEVNYCWCHR